MLALATTWVSRGMVGLRAALLTVAGMLLAANAVAQRAPSAAEMEAFRNLPPEQQRAVLEGLGGAQDGVRRDRDLSMPETVRPRTTTGGADRAGFDLLFEDMEFRPREPRMQGGDTVVLDIQLRPLDPARLSERTEEESRQLKAMLELALRGNPYRLDASGVLRIPGVAPIPLAGLTEKQATERLTRDPALSEFTVKVLLLPLEKTAAEALQPFGYDLFAGVPSTFAPVTDVPVPSEYVVGPGDRIEVQLIGSTRARHSLVVGREGRIMFPELGPIVVGGLQFAEARAAIEARVGEQMIGTQAVVTMGDLRSIRVFVLGEAERPGSFTVSGLATMTNALFASGGVKPIGSLRNIQLKRNGNLVRTLDLYDLLLHGDTSSDARLQPGDVIFIPPVGSTVGVTGAVRRPAIYELRAEGTAADLVHLGGGLLPDADPRLARIERIDERRERVVIDVDLSSPAGRSTRLRAGDVLTIPGARPTYANAVRLTGHVHRPGSNEYRNGLRLTDLIPSVDDLKPNADLHYVLIRRESPGTRRLVAFSADLEQAWREPGSDADPLLAARDQVFVFDLESGRRQHLDPLLDELRLQAGSDEPSLIVRVAGRVRAPGDYPLEPGMTISDLVRAGGGLTEQAFGDEAELARYETFEGHTRRTQVVEVDLTLALRGDAAQDMALRPFDTLVIKEISEWSQQEFVRLEGEVRFPGEYPISRGETLRSVIARAGGLTPLAFPQGSVFTRESLREREREQLRKLGERLKRDLSTLALEASQAGGQSSKSSADTLSIGESLLKDLESVQPVGRLVIDLDRVMTAASGSTDDLLLRHGDRLRVPKTAQEVTVIGEVQNSISHLYDPSLSRDDYIRMSGGMTQKADDDRIYVVRASGSVDTAAGRRFRSGQGMQPGDTVVVPLDAERMRPLALWTAVTTILYNIAISVAAVNSF